MARRGFSLFLLLLFSPLRGEEETLFLAKLPNPHEYSLFGTSGWNGNWYIGPDHCWIQKISLPGNLSRFKKVYAGAKIGRAKPREEILRVLGYPGLQEEYRKKEKEKENLTGDDLKRREEELTKMKKEMDDMIEKTSRPKKIYIAVSATLDFRDRLKVFPLAESAEIPLEGSPEEAVEGIGEARWFWAEIPADLVRDFSSVYLACWSDDPLYNRHDTAPIIASGWGDQTEDSWMTALDKDRPDSSQSKGISYFEPALAVKLVVSEKDETASPIKIKKWDAQPDPERQGKRYIVRFWLEMERDSLARFQMEKEEKQGFVLWGFPFWNSPAIVTVKDVEKGRYRVRALGRSWSEEESVSPVLDIEIK